MTEPTPRLHPCPRCKNTEVERVGFSWWGGYVGPRLLSHTRCPRCTATFNGKTGASNDTAIAIYTVGATVLVGLLFYLTIKSW